MPDLNGPRRPVSFRLAVPDADARGMRTDGGSVEIEYSDVQLGDELVRRLADFAPVVTVARGDFDDQVVVEIVMSRTSRPQPQRRRARPVPDRDGGGLRSA